MVRMEFYIRVVELENLRKVEIVGEVVVVKAGNLGDIAAVEGDSDGDSTAREVVKDIIEMGTGDFVKIHETVAENTKVLLRAEVLTGGDMEDENYQVIVIRVLIDQHPEVALEAGKEEIKVKNHPDHLLIIHVPQLWRRRLEEKRTGMRYLIIHEDEDHQGVQAMALDDLTILTETCIVIIQSQIPD